MSIRCLVFPATLLPDIDIFIIPGVLRVGPMKLFSGPFTGSYIVTADVIRSCPEWADNAIGNPFKRIVHKIVRGEAVPAKWSGVTIQTINETDLINPDTPK